MGRKKPETLVNQIFDVLANNEAKSTNEIALAIGSNTRTIKDYVHLIETIQAKPQILVERTKNITVVRVEKSE